ncbi:MAG: SpaA isopeptide-forming pilin-related protein, partial [Bacilli bacterium]
MKKSLLIFTLITTLLTIGITLSIKNVQATTTEQFHEAEYIPNIWVNKEKAGKIRYQQARFLRRTSDNQFSYCIEPWEIISSDALYPDKIDINQLDDYTLNQIALIAYYGYGYKGHTHEKWYYITQLMIWEQVDKTANFYFTDKLNGNKISPFDFEIYEINELVQKHSLKPSFDQNNYTILLGENLNLVDTNRVLPSYITKTDMFSYTQSGDNITIESSAIGKSDITFLKKDNIYNYPPIIYRSSTNQDFLTVGSYKDITAKITVEVIGGSIELNKIDALTKTKTPSCKEASLIGSTFEIFNEQNTLIAHIYINDNTNPIIAGLTAGTYKIQEISAGPGYQLNKNAKYITLENTKPHALVTIENKVIEKDITIEKY